MSLKLRHIAVMGMVAAGGAASFKPEIVQGYVTNIQTRAVAIIGPYVDQLQNSKQISDLLKPALDQLNKK